MLMFAMPIDANRTLQWKKFVEHLIGVSERVYATIGELVNGALMILLKLMECVTD